MTVRGDGRTFLRGRTWWIAYYGPAGEKWQQIRESSGSESEVVAQKLLKRRIREVENHRDGTRHFGGPKQERVTVAKLLDSLKANYQERGIKSLGRTLNHMKPVRDFFGHYRAAQVTPDTIRAFKKERREDGASDATINRALEILSAAYNLAIKEERLSRRPHIEFLSETGNAREGFLEQDELERIVAKLAPPLDAIARFAHFCGWRKAECRLLKWQNVDRSAKEVRLEDSKNGKGRVLPLPEELWSMFERLWPARQYQTKQGPALSEYVFHVQGKPLGDTGFERRWRKAAAAANLSGKLFHDLRRTAARNLIRAGVPQSVAMKITGHETDSMFRRYSIVTTDDTRAAMEKVAEQMKSRPEKSNVTPIGDR